MSKLGTPPSCGDEENEGVVQNPYQKAIHSQFIGQWITSLAISVICCAILFVVFAGYIVQLHDKANMAGVRIEVLQEKYNQVVADIAALRRVQPQAVFNIQGIASRVETPAPSAMVGGEPAMLATEEKPATAAPSETVGTAPASPAAPQSVAPPKEKNTTDLGVPVFDAPATAAPLGR